MQCARSVAFLSLFCIIALGCAASPSPSRNYNLSDEESDRLRAIIADTTSRNGVVGHSVAILSHGKLVYEARGGFSNIELQVPTSNEDRYQIYSATKLFFNVALMQLVEDGRLNADLPLSHYLDDLSDRWGMITVRQAWSHMTGTPDILGNTGTNQEVTLASISGKPLEFEPGSSTQYNQTNFLLLKFVFESIAGQSYQSYLEEYVLAPAGLAEMPFGDLSLVAPNIVSHYERSNRDVSALRRRSLTFPPFLYTSAGINITLEEFVRWFQMLLNGRFVSVETLQQHWNAVLQNDGTPSYRSNGWERIKRNGVLRIGHGGGGRIHLFHFVPDSDPSNTITIFYLDNGGIEVFDHRRLADRLANNLIPGVLSADDEIRNH